MIDQCLGVRFGLVMTDKSCVGKAVLFGLCAGDDEAGRG